MGSDATMVYSSEFLLAELSELGDAAARLLALGVEEELLGDLLTAADRVDEVLPALEGPLFVRLALAADALYVAGRVIAPADSNDAEASYLLALTHAYAPLYRALRRGYAAEVPRTLEDAHAFLRGHRADAGLFGFGSNTTRWFGLELMRRLGEETGDEAPLDEYLRLMARLADEIDALDDFRGSAANVRDEMAERAHPSYPTTERPPAPQGIDPRTAAFLTKSTHDVFECVAHAHDVWRRDPCDVEGVHAEVRAVFSDLVETVVQSGEQGRGRMLLVLGEAGSGKTHLLRAFRERVHGARSGYAAYVQAAAFAEDVEAELAAGVLASLEMPYDEPDDQASGLLHLSDALLGAPTTITRDVRTRLSSSELDDVRLGEVASSVVDDILRDPRFSDLDLDLMRALLLLQRREARVSARVLKYLRGDPLSPRDSALLGHPAPRRASGARATLRELGRLIGRVEGGAFVLLVDQLEQLASAPRPIEQLVRTLDALRGFVDHVPHALVVVTCARDFYVQSKAQLAPALVDRLEREPPPEQLVLAQGREELEAVLGRRMAVLLAAHGQRPDPREPCFPLPESLLEGVDGYGLREALDRAGGYRARCVAAGRMVSEESLILLAVTQRPPVGPMLSVQYQLHLEGEIPIPGAQAERLALLAETLQLAARDLGFALEIGIASGHLRVRGPDQALSFVIAFDSARDLALSLDEARHACLSPVVVRVPDEPRERGPSLVALRAAGAHVLELSRAAMREFAAFRSFAAAHAHEPAFWSWVRNEKPLLRVPALLPLLGLACFPGEESLDLALPPLSQSGPFAATAPSSGIIAKDDEPPARRGAGSD